MGKFWTWFKSFFSNESKAKIARVIDEVQDFVEMAMPVVVLIDEKLKPLIDRGIKFKDIYAFLKEHGIDGDEAFNLAQKLIKLPIPEMLVSIAVTLLQSQSTVALSISVLKLSIELAYRIYKSTKDDGQNN